MQNKSKSFSFMYKKCFILLEQKKCLLLTVFCQVIVFNIFLKKFSSITVIIMGLLLWINSSNIRYIFCNNHFKDFLESQMSKDKPTPLLAIKNLLFWWDWLSSFLYIVIFLCIVFILNNCNYSLFKPSITVFEKKL